MPAIYKERVRGNGLNDIFVVGSFGLVLHWNGQSWHSYPDLTGKYYGLAVNGNTAVAAGTPGDFVAREAIILVGTKK